MAQSKTRTRQQVSDETYDVSYNPEETWGDQSAVEVAQSNDGSIVVQSASVSQLASIASFQDALRLAQDLYGELIPSYDLGDGFNKLGDKDDLVGVPFVIMGWGLGWSAFDDEGRFSIVRVVTQDGGKYRFSDGSSGIHKTLMDKFDGDPANFRALVALGGLRRSDYKPRNQDGSPVLDGKGKAIQSATTYFIDSEKLDIASVR